MMPATEWDRELIARFAAQSAGLGKSRVVGTRWFTAAREGALDCGSAAVNANPSAGTKLHIFVDFYRTVE
jgi:hypothetical protein